MKMPLLSKVIAAVAASAILQARASTFTVGGSGNTFTVSRSGAGVAAAETVRYRTVPLSAFPGQHYTADSGTFLFAPGQTSTNVVITETTPTADATDTLNVTGKIGTISDLAGKEFTGSVSANSLATLDSSHVYAITYDLAGGALPEGASNPTTYTYETPSFTLAPPVRPGYNFAGWTEGSGSTPNPSVAIYRFHGDRAYVANWTPITYSVHFDAAAGEGSMPDQTLTYDAPQALSSNAFTRVGYTFAGWRVADGAIYADGAEVINLTNAQDAVTLDLAGHTLNAAQRFRVIEISRTGDLTLTNSIPESGDDLDALAPKAASGITYSEGEATIFVPASAGWFVKSVIGLTAPAEGE